jgi:hypothetical protein
MARHDPVDVHAQDESDQYPPVPLSSGPPRILLIGFMVAIVIIFIQGSFVVGSSAVGRIWPAEDSAKIPL